MCVADAQRIYNNKNTFRWIGVGVGATLLDAVL